MNIQLESISNIEAALDKFGFIETGNPQIPVIGRIIIGTAQKDDSLKMIVLEIGLEPAEGDKHEWYWEISLNDESTTEYVSKVHNTGFTTYFRPSCAACSVVPMEFHGGTLKDFSGLIINDIKRNFID